MQTFDHKLREKVEKGETYVVLSSSFRFFDDARATVQFLRVHTSTNPDLNLDSIDVMLRSMEHCITATGNSPSLFEMASMSLNDSQFITWKESLYVLSFEWSRPQKSFDPNTCIAVGTPSCLPILLSPD
jgi:hypothetical protein